MKKLMFLILLPIWPLCRAVPAPAAQSPWHYFKINGAHEAVQLSWSSIGHDITGVTTKILNWFEVNQLHIFWMLAGMLASGIAAYISGWIVRNALRRIRFIGQPENARALSLKLSRPVAWLVFLFGTYESAMLILDSLAAPIHLIVTRLFIAGFIYCMLRGALNGIELVDNLLKHFILRSEEKLNELMIMLARKFMKAVVWVIAVLFFLQNVIGMNITALLAGAGVLGLAVAFAAQKTIANFLSSIMVILDKPFAVGDRIKVNGADGVVEEMGLRSTKLRSLDGNLLNIPNALVADSNIENITRRPNIKCMFDIGLTYDTTPEKMELAIKILHEILDHRPEFNMHELAPRIFFNEFRDYSLNISVIAWFHTEWIDYLANRNNINLEILRRFNAAGLEFAFPTSTNHIFTHPIPKSATND